MAVLVATARSGCVPMLIEVVTVSDRAVFAAWPIHLHILAQGKLNPSAQGSLDRRLIDFTVPLRRVSVADLEERALREHRNIKSAAGDELAIVHVAGVPARRIASQQPALT